jgi:hypothetical protein
VRGNIERTREVFTWPRVVEPLARLAALGGGVVEPPRPVAKATTRYAVLALQAYMARRGLVGGARDLYRILRRPPLP